MGVGLYTERSIQVGNGVSTVYHVPYGMEDEDSIEIYYSVLGNSQVEVLLSSPGDYAVTAVSTASISVVFTFTPVSGSFLAFRKIAKYHQFKLNSPRHFT